MMLSRFIIVFIFLLLSACSSTTTQNVSDNNEDPNKKIATAKINTQLGMAYLEQHKIQRAKSKLLLALDQAPNIPDTWYSMAYFLEVTGEKEQAKKYYLKALSLAPERGDVQNNFGTYLCRNGQVKAAIDHFELAANDINYVDQAGAFENAGLCALKIPNKNLALSYFNKANESDPDKASVYLELAELNYQQKNYRAAKQNLEEFLRLSPPNKASFSLSARLHQKKILTSL